MVRSMHRYSMLTYSRSIQRVIIFKDYKKLVGKHIARK